MPKPGFKSITIKGETYDKLMEIYLKNKPILQMQGVNSFSAFSVYTLETLQKRDKTFHKYPCKFEKISIDKERIVIQDNFIHRVAEIKIRSNRTQEPLYCELCEKSSCLHIGFVYSLSEAYPVMM